MLSNTKDSNTVSCAWFRQNMHMHYMYICTYIYWIKDRLRMFYWLLGRPMNLVGESNLYKERSLSKKNFLFSNMNNWSKIKVNENTAQKAGVQKSELWSCRLRKKSGKNPWPPALLVPSPLPAQTEKTVQPQGPWSLTRVRSDMDRQTDTPSVCTD